MKTFKIVWRDKKEEIIQGETISEAFNSAYGAGALRAVDYYEELRDYKQEKLINGLILAGQVCPYKSKCEMGDRCLHAGEKHLCAFSCAMARSFEI